MSLRIETFPYTFQNSSSMQSLKRSQIGLHILQLFDSLGDEIEKSKPWGVKQFSLYSFLLIANMMTNFHWSCKNRWKNSWNESGFGTRIWQMGIGNPLWITNTHLSPPNHQSTFISRIFSSIFTRPMKICHHVGY